MSKDRARRDDAKGAPRAPLMLLVRAVQDLAGARSLDEVVSTLRATTRTAIGADGIAVVLRDGDKCHYVAEDAPSRLWTGQRFPIDDCISGHAMREGVVIAIPDIHRDPRVPQAAYADTFVRSMAAAPIGAPKATATLCAYWAEPGAISPEALESLQALASAAATAIENGRLFEALVASERRLRNLFQVSPAGMAIYDVPSRVILDVNDTMLRLAGMTRREYTTGAWDFVRATLPEHLVRDDESREQILRTGSNRPYEKTYVHRSGAEVPVLMTAAPLDDGTGATIVVAQDLTAMKAAEAALAENEALLRGITETVHEAFYTLDWDEAGPRVAYISAAFEDIWGRSRESLVAAPMSFLDAIHPDDRQRVEQVIARQLGGQETETEYRIQLPAGAQKWIHDRAYPVFDKAGKVVRTIGVAEDITERKHVEMRAETIAREMDHRARNLMTIVRGIITQTLRSQPVPPGITELLLGRLSALSAAHKAVLRHNWKHAEMTDLVALALEPFSAFADRMIVAGPDVEFDPQIGVLVALSLHELATNALKHGAFSRASGEVELRWEHATLPGGASVRIIWRERGGPAPAAAACRARSGFGSDLLGQGLAWYGGETRLDFAAEGLTATITLPLKLNAEASAVAEDAP